MELLRLIKNNQMTEQTVDMRMDGWKMEWLSVCEMCCARLVNGEKENTRKNQDNQKYFFYIALEFAGNLKSTLFELNAKNKQADEASESRW